MTEYHSSPKLVYLQIQNIVNNLLDKVSIADDLGSNNLSYDILSTLHQELSEKLASLEENSEWDTYTIAFYGETNAGKSTIVEALRLLLKEENKLLEQEKFKSWSAESGCTQEAFEQLRSEINAHNDELKTTEQNWRSEKEKLEEKRKRFLTEYNKQKFQIQKRKDRATFMQRVKWLFKTMPHMPEFKQAEKDLEAHLIYLADQEKNYESIRSALKDKLTHKEKYFNGICSKVKEAERFADGNIIGNGRADFTNDTYSYPLTMNGVSVCLLDIPGIEGNEEKVADDVEKAMQKAHAVVYVTSKASSPETGEGGDAGTLEKICKHLKPQAHIWSIYNKRISNPLPLSKPELVSENERSSLLDMDMRLRESIGEMYQSSICVSGYPAFLGAATCLLPGSTHIRSQEKFTETFSKYDLIEKSNIQEILDILMFTDPEAIQSKINYANQKKAKQVALEAITQVAELQNDTFVPLLEQLNQNAQDIGSELETELGLFNHRLNVQVTEKLNEFEHLVRVNIYTKIDEEINHDDFCDYLEKFIDDHQRKLKDNVIPLIENQVADFKKEIRCVVERYQDQVSDLIGLYNTSYKVSFSLDAECNLTQQLKCFTERKRIDVSFGLYQSALSLISHSIKKTNQKKSTDDNLREIVQVLNVDLETCLDVLISDLQENIDEIKLAVTQSTLSIQEAQENLRLATCELHQLVEQLEANK